MKEICVIPINYVYLDLRHNNNLIITHNEFKILIPYYMKIVVFICCTFELSYLARVFLLISVYDIQSYSN